MRKARFSEEQMVKILREADKSPVAEVAKRHGVSDQTIYAWRKRYGELDAAGREPRRASRVGQDVAQQISSARIPHHEIENTRAGRGECFRYGNDFLPGLPMCDELVRIDAGLDHFPDTVSPIENAAGPSSGARLTPYTMKRNRAAAVDGKACALRR